MLPLCYLYSYKNIIIYCISVEAAALGNVADAYLIYGLFVQKL